VLAKAPKCEVAKGGPRPQTMVILNKESSRGSSSQSLVFPEAPEKGCAGNLILRVTSKGPV
jgi:hypothetical protein